VRGSETPLYAFGARLREVLPYVPLFSGHRVGIAVVSYAGRVVFGLGSDRTSTPDLADLAEGIQASYEELRAAAGGTHRKHAA
jgi:diacylglycerol O-acyltransferase